VYCRSGRGSNWRRCAAPASNYEVGVCAGFSLLLARSVADGARLLPRSLAEKLPGIASDSKHATLKLAIRERTSSVVAAAPTDVDTPLSFSHSRSQPSVRCFAATTSHATTRLYTKLT
jgi:hypothetical protein